VGGISYRPQHELAWAVVELLDATPRDVAGRGRPGPGPFPRWLRERATDAAGSPWSVRASGPPSGVSEPQGRRPEWLMTILSASWRALTGSPMPTGGTDPLVWHSGHLTS
jgi:hypothetical protein